MKNSSCTLLSLFLASLVIASSIVSASAIRMEKAPSPEIGEGDATEKPKIYLVFVKYPPGVNKDAFVNKILEQVLGSVDAAKKALIYHHKQKSLFAARFSLNQVKELQKNPDVEGIGMIGRDGRDPSNGKSSA